MRVSSIRRVLCLLMIVVILLGYVPNVAKADGSKTLTVCSNLPGAALKCTVTKTTDTNVELASINNSGSITLTDNIVDCHIQIKSKTNFDKNYLNKGWVITIGDMTVGPLTEFTAEDLTSEFSGYFNVLGDGTETFGNANYINLYGTVTADITITAYFEPKSSKLLTIKGNAQKSNLSYTIQTGDTNATINSPGIYYLELPKVNKLIPIDVCLKSEGFTYNSDSLEFKGLKITIGSSSYGPVTNATAAELNEAFGDNFAATDDSLINISGPENLLCLKGTVKGHITVEACFEEKSVPVAAYTPQIKIATGDEEKAKIISYQWIEDTEEGSLYEFTVELKTSPYDKSKGNYDLYCYTVGEDTTPYLFNLTSNNYHDDLKRDTVKGNWNSDGQYGQTFVIDENGNEYGEVDVNHYSITSTVVASSNQDIDLHFCDGWMELSLVTYQADVFSYETAYLSFLVEKEDYEDIINQQLTPLVSGLDGKFTLLITTHGLCYNNDKTRSYEIRAYNGLQNETNQIANYRGVKATILERPFGNLVASAWIWFIVSDVTEINQISINLTLGSFTFNETYDVISASDILQVQEFANFYQSTYGLDKFGEEAYSEAEKNSSAYIAYEHYSPYRYALRDTYYKQLKAIAFAGVGNYENALTTAISELNDAAEGKDCNTVVWSFVQSEFDGTPHSRPIIVALPQKVGSSSRYANASDAIEATLEAEWPGNWTYTFTPGQFGAFVTHITAGQTTDIGSIVFDSGYYNYAFFYYNDKFSEWGVSNYYPSDGDVMIWDRSDSAVLDSDFTWVWAILRWKLGDAEIERVLNVAGIEYESSDFYALGADGLAALFPVSNYPDVKWCTRGDGQFSRYGQLRELGPEDEVIRLINAIGTVSPQSGAAITAARNAYDALDAETQAKVTNYDVLTAAEATFNALSQITPTTDTVRGAIMSTLAADPENINTRSINGEWKLLALARDGRITKANEIAQNYLLLLKKALGRGDTVELVTDYERVTLALTSLGIEDVTAFQYDENSEPYNLTAPFATYKEDMLLNQKIYALLALNAKPYTGEAEKYVSGILAAALPEGGWSLSGTGSIDVDMTAMAIQALAPYYQTNAEVKAAIDGGLAALKAVQDETYGGFYGMGQYNSCSTAQVIVALCSLGIDPTGADWTVNGKYNPVTALCQFYIQDTEDSSKGKIKYTLNASAGDDMSTEQAAYALAAYYRLLNNKDTLYDMSALFTTPEANQAALNTLKETLEAADWTLAQAEAEDATAAKEAAEAILAGKLTYGVTAELTVTAHTAATAGTRENEDGTNGKYSFTIALSIGGTAEPTHATATAAITDAAITATKYFATQDDADLDALRATLEGMTWTLDQAEAEDATAAQSAVEALLTDELLNGATATVTVAADSFQAAIAGTAEDEDGTDGSYTAAIALSKGASTLSVTVTGTITPTAYVDPNSQITVTFRLIGAYPAGKKVDMSVSADAPDYVTWIPTKTYTIPKTATMYDLFTVAMTEAGLNSTGADDGYVKSIYAPAVLTGYKLGEFTNGDYSGWMYTVNGKHPGIGLDSYYFAADADIMASGQAEVVWHYENDYRYEIADWTDGTQGDASTWNKWLEAPDVAPTAVPVSGIVLDQSTASVLVGDTLTLTATVTPSYALDKAVTWTSSDDSTATVVDGVVTGVKAGTVTITAKAGEKSATCTVTVTTTEIAVTGVTLDKSTAEVETGSTLTLTATVSPENATNKTVTWSSSDESIATVADGVVTGVKAGTVTITAKAGDKTATCTVTVSDPVVAVTGITLDKTEASVAVGKTVTLTATVSPASATDKTVTWTSSDESTATVADGVVTGVKAGTVTITAKAGDKTATCTVTVVTEEVAVTGIALDQSEVTVTAGRTVTLTATVSPENATDKTVIWESSDDSIATVADGVVTGTKAGTAVITAKAGDKTATCTVKVEAAQELPYQEKLNGVLAYLKSTVTNPKMASQKGEWAVLALNRAGAAKDSWNEIYLDNLKASVAAVDGVLAEENEPYTEYSRVILALTSLGVDASQFSAGEKTYDLVAPLLEKQTNGTYRATEQGNNGAIFALIALDTHDYLPGAEGKAARAAFIASLQKNRLDNGAWSISGKGSADLDTTAAVVYALAPYYLNEAKLNSLGGTVTYAEVKDMVDGALSYLSAAQNEQGGFGSAEADVWAVVALSSLGRDANADAAFIKNGNSLLADLLSYYDETSGGFRHQAGGQVNQMASEQAAYGLAAYDRFKNGKNTLYDMSDVKIASLEEKANKAAAEEVEDLIDAIGEVTLESKAKIDAARAAYDALTDAQKALVGNLKTLTDAKAAYEKLAAKADQEEVDKAAAKGVEDLIEAIGKVTLDSEKAIKAARSAYDALTDAQKALVKNLATLEDAEKQLKDMQEAAEVLAAVTFHLRNGSSEEITDGEEKVYTKGDEGNDLPDASREGYEFQGWFDFPTDGTKYTKVSADLPEDLYAQWKSTSSGGGSSGSSETKIKVSFRLIGAEKADKKVDLGTEEYMPDYVTWIATTTYEMEEGDTVYDLWVKATHDRGIESEGADNNYVKTVYAPASLGGYALSEFTNGPRSGWMYTINGRHPGYGLVEQELKDGDRIIWHYVNDYAYEVADWIDDGQWQSLGDGRYYSRWLKAPDRFGGAGGGLGEGAKSSSSGGGSGSSGSDEVTDLIPSYDGDTVWIPTEVEHSEGGMAYAADAELTKDIVTKGLEKAEDKSKLKLWVDIQDSNRLVLQVDPEAMKEISDAGAGLRLQCSKGVIELDAETVAQLADSGRQVRMTVSYDDWYEKTKVSVGAFPPKDTDTPVTMKVELPVTKDGQALSIVNGDGSRTPIKKSAIIGDRAYAEVTGAVTLEITDIQKYWNDVKEKDWFADAVQFAVSHELMNGVDRYEFAPNAPMTRAMLVTVLYRLEDEPEITGSGDSFGDVDAKGWYAEAVAWASENGLVNGTEKGFEPNANISREQIATILYRYAKYIGLVGQDDAVSGDVSKFEDRESVSPWAQEAMAWAVEVGLFKGDDTNSLNPQGEATRAEVATLLERLIKLIVLS